ncbi:MAG: histidinol-phosphate transaminase [Candidatus Gracilibacteria bacterium]|jgi:histidinol-phosphate aminotransferase
MNKYANSKIQAMNAYFPPIENRRKFANDGGVLCDFNEGIQDEDIAKEILKEISNKDISIYPEYTNGLLEQISAYCNVNKDQVMLTNGSDQGIDLIFRTFTNKGDKVIIPSPSFAMFYQYAQIAENKMIKPAYGKDGTFPLKEVLKEIDEKTKLVVICNPNNPTGTLISLEDIEMILKKALKFNSIVYIDEAYYEFSKLTAVGLIKKYPNLIITRTFSKAFALAGLRIGYVLGQKDLLIEMRKIISPYDVNMVAVIAAKISLNSLQKIQKIVDEIIKARKLLEDFFEKQNIFYWPSKANFILFKPTDSKKVFEELEKRGIRIRQREGVNIEDTLRISVGNSSEIEKIIQILKKIL